MKKILIGGAAFALLLAASATQGETPPVYVEEDGLYGGLIPVEFVTSPRARPTDLVDGVYFIYGRCWVIPATTDEEGNSVGFCLDQEGNKF